MRGFVARSGQIVEGGTETHRKRTEATRNTNNEKNFQSLSQTLASSTHFHGDSHQQAFLCHDQQQTQQYPRVETSREKVKAAGGEEE